MKIRFLIVLAIGVHYLNINAQNNLSGTINVYTAVLSIEECSAAIQVSDASLFEIGKAVLLIQMQGAQINASNNPNYGDITDIGSAGLFEKAVIASIDDNNIFLENTLINTYNPTDKIQLISIPVYEDAVVTNTLSCQPWNGTTGGVLVFEVENTLTMEAEIDISGTGFRGGSADIIQENDCFFAFNHSNYAYEEGNWRGASKGEGIAIPVPNQEVGRGALANAGGGGNDHNSGGGGGGHLTNGGKGGNNDEPSNFGCDGLFPGEGGKGIAENDARLFMGGGGGAGHENNNVATAGGNGGGILIMKANTLTSQNFRIRSNGETPPAGGGDGAGGGGAGGSLLLDLQTVTDNLILEAKGGNGGDTDNNNADRCFGPGGGGSGGRIIVPDLIPNANDLAGGTPGLSLNSSVNGCPNGPNGGQSGQSGIIQNDPIVPMSDTPIGMPNIIDQPLSINACEGEEISITVAVEGSELNFQWQIDEGSGFNDINEIAPYSGVNSNTLTISNLPANLDNVSYQLVITSACFPTIISGQIPLAVNSLPTADFEFTITDLTVNFTNTSIGGTSFSWDFDGAGNGDDSDPNPVYIYDMAGTYMVSLAVTNSCGTTTITQTVNLTTATISALFQAAPLNGCAPLLVNFENLSSDNATDFEWSFPGGIPATSNDFSPQVTYNNSGIFSATLIAANETTQDTFILSNAITVETAPIADFNFDINDLTVSFQNNSTGGTNVFWDFGDTNSSITESPTHTYDEPGVYLVSLLVENDCGEDMISISLIVGDAPQADFTAAPQTGCAPLSVTYSNLSTGLYDNINWTFPGGTPSTSIEENPVVTYLDPGQFDVTLSINGPLGSNNNTVANFIAVQTTPTASFSFDTNGNTVTFQNTSIGGTQFNWNFGDDTSSDMESPMHTYENNGTYEVILTVENECGSSSFSSEIIIGDFPQAAFTLSNTSGCEPHLVQFQNSSTGQYEGLEWSFPGGNPAFSTDENPSVIYNSPGEYDVSLTIFSSLGDNTTSSEALILVFPFPTSDFEFSIDGNTVSFQNTSLDANIFSWNFGDGFTSDEVNPVHTFATNGLYTVTLNAGNPFCGTSISYDILINVSATNDLALLDWLSIYPNPFSSHIQVDVQGFLKEPIALKVYSSTGQLLHLEELSQTQTIDLGNLPSGLYGFVVEHAGNSWYQIMVKP